MHILSIVENCKGMSIPLDDNAAMYTIRFTDDEVLITWMQENTEYIQYGKN